MGSRSRTITLAPRWASRKATLAPMQPAPMTTTSARCGELTTASRRNVRRGARASRFLPLTRQLSIRLGKRSRVAKERRDRIADATLMRALEPAHDLLGTGVGPRERHLVVARLAEAAVAIARQDDLRLARLQRADDELGAVDARRVVRDELASALVQRGRDEPHHLRAVAVEHDDLRFERGPCQGRHPQGL